MAQAESARVHIEALASTDPGHPDLAFRRGVNAEVERRWSGGAMTSPPRRRLLQVPGSPIVGCYFPTRRWRRGRTRKEASGTPRGRSAAGVKRREPAAALFCMITCLIYFASEKLWAMTEPIYGDPRVSVRPSEEGCHGSAPRSP